jgi:hypothetical protein
VLLRHLVILADRQVRPTCRYTEIMHCDDVRMIQLRQDAAFPAEPLGERRVGGEGLRQDFQGDETIQLGLARLEDKSHSALADEFQDFKLGKRGGEFRHARRGLVGRGLAGFGGDGGGGEQTFGAKPLRRIRRQRRLALGTMFRFGGNAHVCYLSRRWRKVTRKVGPPEWERGSAASLNPG